MWACPRCPVAAGRLAQSRGNNAITFHVFFPFFSPLRPNRVRDGVPCICTHSTQSPWRAPTAYSKTNRLHAERHKEEDEKEKAKYFCRHLLVLLFRVLFSFLSQQTRRQGSPTFWWLWKELNHTKGEWKKFVFSSSFLVVRRIKKKKSLYTIDYCFLLFFFSHRLSFSARIFFKWFCSQRRGRGEGSKIERKVFSYIDFVSFVLLSIPIGMPIESS